MKRFLKLAIVPLLMLLCLVLPVKAEAAEVASGTCGDNLTWMLDGAGTLTISGIGAMTDYAGATDQPWYNYNSEITKLVIEDGVTAIGECAFALCKNLQSIDLGRVSSIGRYAFGHCESLGGELLIPDSMTSIGDDAFGNCSHITEITFTGTTVPVLCSFGSLTRLDHIYVPGESLEAYTAAISVRSGASIQAISSDVTRGTCGEDLTWVFDEATSTLTISGNGAMTNFESKTGAPWSWYGHRSKILTVVIDEGVTTIGDYAFRYCDALEGQLVIPDSVTGIGKVSFQECGNIDLIIGSGLKEIPSSTFGGSGVKSIDFGAVTSIGEYVFSDCDGLDGELIIPDSVISMGNGAFDDCDGIDSLTIGNGLSTISGGSFMSCDELESIDLGSIMYIEDGAFHACTSLKNIDLTGVITIGWEAFSGCRSLAGELLIPDTVTTIGSCGFGECPNLTAVTLGSGLSEMQGDSIWSSFYGCTGLTDMTFTGNTPPAIGGDFTSLTALEAVYVPSDSLTEYTTALANLLPTGATIQAVTANIAEGTCGENLTWGLAEDGTLTISGSGAMTNYSSSSRPWWDYRARITHVEIEDGVSSIANNAFASCANLQTISIPNSIQRIGSYAFYGSINLTSVSIPAGVTSIESSTFSGCDRLASVVLPDGLISIASCAFEDCDSLETIVIPESVTSIASLAFYGCESLHSVTLSGNIKEIDYCVFQYCSALTEITIPASVTTIWDSAFGYCSSLTKITFRGRAPGIYKNAFYNVIADAYYPESFGWGKDDCQNYGGTITWTSYESDAPATPAPDLSISGTCGKSLTWKLTEDGTLTISGTGAMTNYYGDDRPWRDYLARITHVKIEDGVTSIGSNAFSDCFKLQRVSISDSVQSINMSVFNSCFNLTSVNIPAGVTSIEHGTFSGCDRLESVVLPDGLTVIDSQAFYACVSLETIVIPESVTSIGSSVFYGCESLRSVTLSENIKEIGRSAFQHCYALPEITIPASVTTIRTYAFSSCNTLSKINFVGKVSNIYEDAFFDVIAECKYPENSGWTEDDCLNYGGKLTWVSYGNVEEDLPEAIPQYPPELKWFFDKLNDPDNYLWASGYYAKIMEQYG